MVMYKFNLPLLADLNIFTVFVSQGMWDEILIQPPFFLQKYGQYFEIF